MPYISYQGGSPSGYTNEDWGFPQSFMMADIAALQYMYGANFSGTSTVYSWSPTTGEMFVNGIGQGAPNDGAGGASNRIFLTIWDGNGTDTYDLSNYATGVSIDLAPGGHSTFSAGQLADLGGGPNGGFARGNVYNAALYEGDTRSLIERAKGGGGNDSIIGNQADNSLWGNGGDDLLNGGKGADILIGGPGNDIFIVDSLGDKVSELEGGGTSDRVKASTSYVLAAGVHVELLTTTLGTSNVPIDLTGNGFTQEIIGNLGANTLHDGGKGAPDLLRGLSGDDVYRVFNAGDVIVESAAQGDADKVVSAVSYALGAGVHVETLQTNSGTATVAIDLTGNEIAQEIIGNAGANRLEGGGGADTLRGLSGADTFVFATKLGGGNIDNMPDFRPSADTIALDDAIFSAFAGRSGTILPGHLRINATGLAQDASDHIIYDFNDGKLFYDADGMGGASGFRFGTVGIALDITKADFVVV
jgi:Ca2+-binding RTX toxin-like protein